MNAAQEALLGAQWAAMAWKEGHRKGLPVVALHGNPDATTIADRVLEILNGKRLGRAEIAKAATCGVDAVSNAIVALKMRGHDVKTERGPRGTFIYSLGMEQ